MANREQRGFQISARTILQLGGELISSDGIAFYELIKNAFDAGSPEVRVDVVSRLPHEVIEQALEQLPNPDDDGPDGEVVTALGRSLSEHVLPGAPGAGHISASLRVAQTASELRRLLDESNEILFADHGHGMALRELIDVFLRIGTPSRLLQRRRETDRVVLGEKGIGRLSTMRLGSKLSVITSRAGEANWHALEIDWRDFEQDLEQLLEEVPVWPREGSEKDDPAVSGTTIRISALRADWTEEKLRHIAATDLSRVTDPFAKEPPVKIRLRFNDAALPIDRMSELLFEHSHAIVAAKLQFRKTAGPVLTGTIDYRLRGRTQDFRLEKNDLFSAAGDVKPYLIERLGPFSMRLYWFNRGILDPIEGIGTVTQVKRLIAQWSGGLMVYRDGFRVPPYGGRDDDWLDLDRTAFGSGGYKLNRAQIIGKVDITSRDNPHLIDQANREGLIDCPEKDALKALLLNILYKHFKAYIELVDEEATLRQAPSVKELGDRYESEEKELRRNLSALRRIAAQHPEAELAPLVARIARQATNIRRILRGANDVRESAERQKDRLLDLAGLGLMAEILAHELNRTVLHALRGLATALSAAAEKRLTSLLRSAEAQLKSLQKRVTVLDSLSTTGRQRTQRFNVAETVLEVFEGRSEQFERHGITAKVEVAPRNGSFVVRMVRGMFYQILENLTENSVYWLKTEKSLNPGFKPSISVLVDATSRSLFFTDNGPGIDPVNAEQVFVPFFSLKKRGKGLGLYVSREYARDQGADLTLSSRSDRKDGRLNTFILNLAGTTKE